MIKRALAAVVMIVAVTVLVPATGDFPTRAAAPSTFMGRAHATFQPARGKIFVLIIGSDSRTGNPLNSRSDAIHIAGINPKTMKGGILNFPRDSYVPIPGHGSGKINEALYYGGPELLAKTLEDLTGIHIDYWVLTAFEGFQGIIRGLGGIKMTIPTDIYDPGGSGAAIEKGRQTLGQHPALAYVRTRKAFSAGDIARTTNQGTFLLAMLRNLRADMREDPAFLLRWLAVTRRYTRFDVPADELFRLAVLTSQVSPKDVGNVTVPSTVGNVGAASVVFISSSADSIYAKFKRTASLTPGRNR